MKTYRFAAVLFLFIAFSSQSFAQFNIVGSALSTGSGCYTLTNTTGQSGAVWNTTPVNLNQPFDITLTLNFGCTGTPQGDDNVGNAPNCGADGISFILQPMSSGVSATDGGVGYQGITPSLGVVMDDFSGNATDPLYDHISIHQNGDVDHGTMNELAAYTTAVGFPANIEDCLDHTFRFQWTPGSPNGTANVWFDGTLTLTYTGNIVSSIFGGNPNVFWGASASTGACMNLQTVCMAIAADFSSTLVCQGQATVFTDQSVSGTPISTYI